METSFRVRKVIIDLKYTYTDKQTSLLTDRDLQTDRQTDIEIKIYSMKVQRTL